MTDARDFDEDRPERAVDTRTPETILVNRANTQLVQHAIDDLPAHYREPLLLCDVEEMSYQEIAEILSIPMGTVMSRPGQSPQGCSRITSFCGRSAPPPGSRRDAALRLPEPTATSDSRGSITTQFGSAPCQT